MTVLLIKTLRLPIRLLQIVIWPLRLIGRLTVGLLHPVFVPAVESVDASANLSNLINSLSSSMATQRGLLLMIGTGLLVLSLVAHGMVIIAMVATNSFDRNLYLLCIPLALFHVGVLAGFTGAMLATPLGQGYKDNK